MIRDLFTGDYTIYWPKEYQGVVDFLKEEDKESEGKIFQTNMEIVVFAAAIGLKEGQTKAIDLKNAGEIEIKTFLGKSEERSLAEIIYIIALCEREADRIDVNLMRDESGERRALEKFQLYAAGGLSILNDLWVTAKARAPYRFLYDTVMNYVQSSDTSLIDTGVATGNPNADLSNDAGKVEGVPNRLDPSRVSETPFDIKIGD